MIGQRLPMCEAPINAELKAAASRATQKGRIMRGNIWRFPSGDAGGLRSGHTSFETGGRGPRGRDGVTACPVSWLCLCLSCSLKRPWREQTAVLSINQDDSARFSFGFLGRPCGALLIALEVTESDVHFFLGSRAVGSEQGQRRTIQPEEG